MPRVRPTFSGWRLAWRGRIGRATREESKLGQGRGREGGEGGRGESESPDGDFTTISPTILSEKNLDFLNKYLARGMKFNVY